MSDYTTHGEAVYGVLQDIRALLQRIVEAVEPTSPPVAADRCFACHECRPVFRVVDCGSAGPQSFCKQCEFRIQSRSA